MFHYYIELCSKPEYMLSLSEKMFVDIFPMLVLLAVTTIIVVVSAIIDTIKKNKK